jgi:hypothetical protein
VPSGGAWTVDSGVLHQTSTAQARIGIAIPVDVAQAYVETQAHAVALGQLPYGMGAYAGVAPALTQSYYCLLGKNNTSVVVFIANDAVLGTAAYPGTLDVGTDAHVVQRLDGPPECTVTEGTATGSEAKTLGAVDGNPGLGTQSMAADFDYVFVVDIGT